MRDVVVVTGTGPEGEVAVVVTIAVVVMTIAVCLAILVLIIVTCTFVATAVAAAVVSAVAVAAAAVGRGGGVPAARTTRVIGGVISAEIVDVAIGRRIPRVLVPSVVRVTSGLVSSSGGGVVRAPCSRLAGTRTLYQGAERNRRRSF